MLSVCVDCTKAKLIKYSHLFVRSHLFFFVFILIYLIDYWIIELPWTFDLHNSCYLDCIIIFIFKYQIFQMNERKKEQMPRFLSLSFSSSIHSKDIKINYLVTAAKVIRKNASFYRRIESFECDQMSTMKHVRSRHPKVIVTRIRRNISNLSDFLSQSHRNYFSRLMNYTKMTFAENMIKLK